MPGRKREPSFQLASGTTDERDGSYNLTTLGSIFYNTDTSNVEVYHEDPSNNVGWRDLVMNNKEQIDISGKLVVDGDVSFNAHLSAVDASFQNNVDISGKLVVKGGDVGIGTTTPTAKLQVGNLTDNDAVRLAIDPDAALIVNQTPTSNTVLNDPQPTLYLARKGTSGEAYGALAEFAMSRYANVNTNANSRLDIKLSSIAPQNQTNVMTLLSNGNVGVGTTDPLSQLHIEKDYTIGSGNNVHFRPQQTISSATGSGRIVGIGLNNPWATAAVHRSITAGSLYYNASIGGNYGFEGYLGLAVANHSSGDSDPYGITEGELVSQTRLAITNHGNVGIGTTTPSQKLDVDGNINVGKSLSNPRIGRFLSGSVHNADKRDSVYFGRWDSNNDLGFLGMKLTTDTHTNLGYGSYSNQTLIGFYAWGNTIANSRVVMTIDAGGNVKALGQFTGSSSLSTSDDRIKENEKLIVNATETLSKLTPQIYDKYETMDLSGSFFVESGLIAQEVYYNAPELRHLVHVSNDIDASGNISIPTPEEMDLSGVEIGSDPDYGSHGWSKTKPSSLNYQGLIPYLIKSNQEQQTTLEQLEARLAALENK